MIDRRAVLVADRGRPEDSCHPHRRQAREDAQAIHMCRVREVGAAGHGRHQGSHRAKVPCVGAPQEFSPGQSRRAFDLGAGRDFIVRAISHSVERSDWQAPNSVLRLAPSIRDMTPYHRKT